MLTAGQVLVPSGSAVPLVTVPPGFQAALSVPSGTVYVGERTLARYAADIGVEYDSLRRYRDVARAYPQIARRLAISWSVHQALAAQPDRLELLASRDWTVAPLFAISGAGTVACGVFLAGPR